MKRGYFLVVVGLSLAGCVNVESASLSAGEIPQTYSQDVFETNNATLPAHWWKAFNDPVLDGILARVLSDNLDVAQALRSLDISRAQLRSFEGARLPALDGFFDNQLSTIFGNNADTDISVDAGVSVLYAVDIWGGRESAINAAIANLEASRLTVEDVRRLAARDAALAYNEVRRAEARLDLLEASLDLQRQTLRIVDARYRAGLAPALDVDRVRADLASTRSQRGLLSANKKQAEISLAVLSGQSVQADLFDNGTTDWLSGDFDSDLFVGVPADLLRFRPDVRSAEAAFVRENALLGVARADLYPSLTLPGIITIGGSGNDGLDEFVTMRLGASLNLPIFDGGARQASLDAQTHRAESAGLAYREAVLNAIGDVETSLVSIQAYRQRVEELEHAVAASESAYAQLEALYREGLSSFLDVLDAQRNLIDSRQAIIDARANLASSVIALHASLGFVSD